MSERVGSDIKQLGILNDNSYFYRFKNFLLNLRTLKFRVVLCRIRPLPTLISKNEMALVWTILKIQKLQLTDLSKLCIFRRWRLDNELRIRFCSEWWRILNDFARFSQHEIFCHLPILDIFFCPEGRSSRTFNQISREMIALKSNICLRSDQSSPKSVQSDQMESLADDQLMVLESLITWMNSSEILLQYATCETLNIRLGKN